MIMFYIHITFRKICTRLTCCAAKSPSLGTLLFFGDIEPEIGEMFISKSLFCRTYSIQQLDPKRILRPSTC